VFVNDITQVVQDVGRVRRQRRQNVGCQVARTSAAFDDREIPRLPQGLPDGLYLARQQFAEMARNAAGGVEVASASDAVAGGGVVTVCRIVERQRHEVTKGQGAVMDNTVTNEGFQAVHRRVRLGCTHHPQQVIRTRPFAQNAILPANQPFAGNTGVDGLDPLVVEVQSAPFDKTARFAL
jgi:hypothetical protein